jgi:putative glutathione S-transferase
MEAVQRTINIEHIKTHYFTSHTHLNTYAIIPASNGPDLAAPSGR